MTDAPKRIWIEDEFGEGHEDQWDYGSWDARNIDGYEHEYVRADVHQALEAERDKLREALRAFKDFDDLPTGAKRPDIFELRVRRKLIAALGESND